MRSTLLMTMAAITMTLATARADVEFNSAMRAALQSCLTDGIDNNRFDKARFSSAIFLAIRCNGPSARSLYTVLARSDIGSEQPIKFNNNDTGVKRSFGSSECYVVRQRADLSPTTEYFCRVALNIGDEVLDRF